MFSASSIGVGRGHSYSISNPTRSRSGGVKGGMGTEDEGVMAGAPKTGGVVTNKGVSGQSNPVDCTGCLITALTAVLKGIGR